MAISSTSFAEHNTAHQKHGAYGYLTRTAPDEPKQLTLPMLEIEASVLADLRASGPRGVIEASTVRFETAARLLWNHMCQSEENFTRSLKWFLYCESAAVRAARDLAALPLDDGAPAAGEVLASYKQVTDEQPTE